jgi:hypothetical protein
MSTAVQLRRGTTAQHATFTGAVGEVTVDTTKDTVVVHDGALPGGYPLAKETDVATQLATKQAASPVLTTYVDTGVSTRNRIINGDMRIDQRNAGASVTVNTAGAFYATDRFRLSGNASSGVFTGQQVTDAPAGFNNSLRVTVTTADASLAAGDFYYAVQPIEGFNIADLGFGSASAQAVTISFWTKSSLTGTFGGGLVNQAVNRSYPFAYTINAANTWEYKTITIPGDTTGTWLTTNDIGMRVYFGLGVGTDFTGTANQWNAAFDASASGAVNVMGTLNATWQVTGVQLEAGSVATPFERRPYGTELMLCQRYYEVISCGNETLTGVYTTGNGSRFNISAIPFAVEKRTAPSMPTVTPTGQWVISGIAAVSANAATNFAPLNPTTRTFGASAARTSGGSTPSASSSYVWEQSATFTASAEL